MPHTVYLVGGRVDVVYSDVPVGLDVWWVKHPQINPVKNHIRENSNSAIQFMCAEYGMLILTRRTLPYKQYNSAYKVQTTAVYKLYIPLYGPPYKLYSQIWTTAIQAINLSCVTIEI